MKTPSCTRQIFAPLPDMPLMVAELVSGLSYEELAFNASEIQSLALQNYRMTLPAGSN
jgi:hypothetical protein